MASVFASNPFALLDEEEEGVIRAPKVQPKPKEEPKINKPQQAAKEQTKVQAVKKADSGDNKEARPPRNFDRPQGERRPRREEQRGEEPSEGKSAVAAGSPGQERPFRPRGDRPAGERRERRERDNGAAPTGNRQQRTFDRRSGTGRGHETNKRGGAGRGNWGSLNDEDKEAVATEERKTTESVALGEETAEETVATSTEAADETAATSEPAAPRELSPEELARQAEREKEEKLMTLDEYLKIKKTVSVPLPEQRKAGEGEDASQWSKFIPARSDKAASEEERKPSKTAKQPEKKPVGKAAVDPALLRFRSETPARRDSDRPDRRDDRRDDRRRRDDRPARGAQQQGGRSTQPATFALDADFPALKA